MTATAETFRAAGPDERIRLVEDLITTSVKESLAGQQVSLDGGTHLSDLAIDSIHLVEMKFALDQLVGVELDVNLFIANPTVHELAVNVAAAAP
ncbi:MAG: acyl carrier protein [Gemmatimonadota bacterium]